MIKCTSPTTKMFCFALLFKSFCSAILNQIKNRCHKKNGHFKRVLPTRIFKLLFLNNANI